MIRLNRFAFSTVALISGAPKYDQYTASIANTLKTVSKGSTSIVGVIGADENQSFGQVYASSSMLDNYEFEVTRAYNTYHESYQDAPIMPYRMYTHYCNYTLVKELEKKGFFNDVFANRISAVVTVGNFSLSRRIGLKLNQFAKANGLVRPYTALFHRQRSERTVANEQFLDFQYYNVEKALWNKSGYVFPSLCVGYEGLYKAFQHLQQFKQDSGNSSFASKHFSYDVSELVKKSRSQFRASKHLSEDKYIFYVDAGTNAKQAKFSLKSFQKGFKEFLANSSISTISHSHFHVFVYVPSNGAEAEVSSKGEKLAEGIPVTFISENQKYAAIAASDFGLLHNGEATVEAAALQLPSLVVDSMTNIHAYFNNLYNGHASPLNIATNYEAYEDLCGSLTAIGPKLGSIMLRHFQTPKLRYYIAKLYREQIQQILSKSNTNPTLSVSETGLVTGCKHLLSKAEAYDSIASSQFNRESQRKAALSL